MCSVMGIERAVLVVLVVAIALQASAAARHVFRVSEELPAAISVGTVGGRAQGVGSGGGAFRFAEDHESLFVIDAISGDIRTSRPIDREALVAAGAAVLPSGEVAVDLVVLSAAASAPPIEVRVYITDVNDHAPAFSEDSVAVVFREEAAVGRRALLDTARDPDAGPNSVDHEAYAIVEGDHAASFRLEATLSPGGERAFLHLVTTTVLDREITSNYRLTVRAQDGGKPPRFGYMKVNISVLDTNDHVPAFERSLYETTVPEDVPVGTSLFTISAIDLDADANGHVTYILSDFTSPFMVDAQGGIVRTRLPLDYEHRREYTVGLRATDGGSPPQSGRSGALVRVTDVNDNAPSVRFVFAPPGARHAAVDQGAPPGTVVALVTATDVDSDEANGFGPGRGPVLSIASGNEWAHFMLEGSPAVQGLGLVKVAESFSRDAQLMYNLTLVASDRGSPSARSTSSHLVIIVRDPAKEALRPPPTFSKTMYKNRLPENAPIGSFVAAVSAHSEDGPLHYSVSGHSRVGGYFVVDRATGLVTTARELDCETAAELALNVSVRAQSGGPSAHVLVRLTVEDLNDNSPSFEQENRKVVVEENAPAGTVVTWMIAHDSDKDLNGTVFYGLLPSGAGFHIDQASGKITTTRVLDREHKAYHGLTVTAMDRGQPSRSAEAFLHVTIADVNDHAPVFRPITYFTVVQPGAARGTFLTTVVAFDPDAGRNGTVLYGFATPVGGHFEIETATGRISLREPLDHSKTYKLLVTARDEGGKDAEQLAEVMIYPVAHDYSLTFKQSTYAFAVFENAPVRTVLGQVSLTAGSPEGVSYYIFKGDPTGVFHVDPFSGMLSVAQPPDREAQETYRLTLVARRGLAAGDTHINISIIDQNDHVPTFILPKDHVALDEESVPGQIVYRASASDFDPGPNSLVSYSLKNNPSGLFHVDTDTGLVTLVGHRWPGVAGTLIVEVMARDHGIPTLSSILTLKVSLPAKNEHPPIFEQRNYVAEVLENVAINTRFLVVRATDPDDVGLVRFTLSSKSDRSGPIGIFPDGWLYIRSTLDRERQSKYDLNVLAYDSGNPPQSSMVTVHVHVIDENDNQPVFESAVYDFEVMEGGLAGCEVGHIHATDADDGAGGEVLYTLETPQPDFSLDVHSGLLSTQRSLDREAASHSSVYSFIVQATDGGWPQALQGQAKVRVHVMDKNDHAPVFSLHIYRVAISEGATMNTPVARLSATDADTGSNAVIQFSITSSNPAHAPFAIDASTGQVKVAGPLNREDVEIYVLNVTAADQGQPQLSSTALILISILDENDCDPIFQAVSFTTDIPEDARPGSLIVTVAARDCDVGTNGELRYTLITEGGDPAHHLFHIDSATGHILLVRPLDFELQTEYRLIVMVEDNGRPSRTAKASLLVRVLDVNDNAPAFLRSKVSFSIAEDSPIGMSVAAASAQDSDTGPNGDLRYSLIQQIPPGNKFSIDPISGIIRVASALDREGRGAGTFLLTVRVTDQALQVLTRLSAITNITITLTDVNDNRPVFVSPPAFRIQAARSGAVLAALSAHDADSGHNGDIRYNLRAPGDDDVAYFSLDSFTGALHLTMASTLQIGRPVLEVEVTASDRGSPPMPPSHIRLAVILSPSTYGPPIHFRTSVQEEQPAGTLLMFLAEQAGARAGDIMSEVTVMPGSASITTEYYLTAAHSVDGRLSAHLFRLERHNGRLETAVSLDRDDGDEHFELEICVLSYTASIPAIVRTIQVEVEVEAVNDMAPEFRATELFTTVKEDVQLGDVITWLSAHDGDKGPHPSITYTLEAQDNVVEPPFWVDTTMGAVRVAATLDREMQTYYRLLARASDGRHEARTWLNIAVQDKNDNVPHFDHHTYTFIISEEASLGTIIGWLSAEDPDAGAFGAVTYSLESLNGGPLTAPLSLHPVMGALSLAGRLDRETRELYTLWARATDGGGLMARARIYVSVADVNDCSPLLIPEAYSAEVDEEVEPGTYVVAINASDSDEGPNGKLEFTVLSGDPEGIFMVDSDGVLTVAGHLDREHQASFGLLIAVSDLASQLHLRHTATARVSVTVRDINDHSPTFEETYLKTSVGERIPVGTTLLVVSAKDLDMGSNGEVEYVLGKGRNAAVAHLQAKQKNSGVVTSVVPQVPNSGIEHDDKAKANMREIYFKEIDEGTKGSSGKESDVPFKLNAITGELRLLAALNHKLMSEYHLVVKASDKGIPKRSTLVELVVSVTSTNDGAPTFIQSLYRATCSESTPPGTVVTRVSATDSDDGPNGEIRYKQGLNSVGDDDDDDEGADRDFRLDPATGELWVARLLDREQKAEYRFRIQAVDNGKPARRGRTEVLVTILDDNDCIPTFGTGDNMVHILENEDAMHKLIAQVKAEDEDLGPGGQLTYALVEGNESGKFSVSPNGQVFLEGALDRELTRLYRLVITATDAGVPPLTGTGTLTVIVKDSNDNAPQFQPEGVVLASVIEDALPGTTVAIIRATDNDEGSNSQIGYTLSGADSHFAVNLDTGTVITTATLDREMQAHYTLVVTATDGGSPSLAASATIAVTVTDANDHTPRFLNAPYVAYVPASAAAGDVLFAVTAHDPDEGLNGVLAFSLEGSNPAFAINSRHGALTAARHLHSSHDGQTFVVAASDGASPPRRARTTLTVRMRKPTDFPRPSGFHGPRAFSLREDVAPGTIVTTVTASSHRRGPVTYGLAAGGNPQNAFNIDPRTGTISVARPLDREMIEMFELLVEARDSGFPPYSRYIPITVDIEDINDNAPDFHQLYCEAEAAENAGPLAEVARVQATDPDAGQNGQIKYDINDGNNNGLFRIDPDTGVVGTTRSLDREQTSQHVLIVVARDGGHPSLEANTTLVLNVRDANDNAPRFARLYTTFVSESAPIGATVIRLEAHDADEDDNGVVTFSLAEPTLPFMIHPNTGSLIVSQPLDREMRASYVVRVLARDPAWTVGSDIAITVTDVNDKVPTFEQSKYEVELPVPAEAGVVITRLRAVDLDEGVNSQVVYVMDSQSDAFRIDPASGEVFTVRRQAIGWPNHFTLLVSALDQGNPQHFSRTSLLIHLVPRNEKPPMFTQPHYFTPVAVSAPIGVSIFHLEANDPDEAGPVLFDAVGGNGTELFVMQDNGWLVLARSIVGLIGHGFGIEARARDQGQPLLVSLATVEVLVTDDNRAGPTFVHGSLATTMAEDAKLGSSVARVSAMDDDKGINGKLSYYLREPSKYFTVNPSSGIITLVNPLAQDVSDDYLLNVCAHDGAWQSRKACIDVSLGITRSSNAPPAFSQSAYMATIAENITFGATVLIVQAAAATYGGLFSYEITGEGSREFMMHPSSGTLTTQAFLDFETVQSYELIAWACSGSSHASGHRDACSHAALYIAVTGVNEYGPLFAEQTFQFTVPESASVGHTIGTVYAYDGDAGVDGIVTYLLATDINPFRLDSVSGVLYVLGPLDHKIIDFTFRVVAKNLGPVQSAGDVDEAIVMVKVTDSNDPPKFSTAIYSTQVSEAASPGTAIITVSATDPDGQASFTDLIYNIAEGNPENIFQIEPDTGLIILQRELDREVVPAYNLTVLAVDQGEPRATGQAIVVVKVLDTNDNAPTLLTVRASVAENRPVGTLVSQLKVNDDDLPPNAKPFTFRLLPRHNDKAGRGLFRLRTGGKLTTARSLDRERISKVLLVVSITDNGNPAQSSTATLTVTITDDNDNAPKARQVEVLVYSFDGAFPGGFVGNVQPNDPDVADRYSCEITSPHRRQPHSFSLESSSCRLIAPGRRSQETFEIKIKGHDGKHPASDTTAHVIFGTFDNVTLENSILLRLSGSLVHFLGHNYRPFLRAARKSLKTRGAGLIIYACSESTENSPSSALFLAAAPRPPKDGQHLYLPPADLTAFFQAEASTLERASAAILESANYDPCEFGGPCHNGGHCYRRLSVEKAIRPVESPPLVLTSHRLLPPAVCECPEGFQGIFCERNIDECASGPCHNGATCIDDVGTYHCTCGRGFEGFACEMDINECLENPCANDGLCENQPGNFFCHCSSGFSGPTCASHIDHCEISPCFNNGTCTDTGDGYTCDCPFGTEGQRCEVHSYGLDELSFLLFPPLEPAPATHVSLRFATTHSNGLLLFIAEPSSAEILALKNSSFLAAQLPTRFPFESLGHSLHFSQPLYSTSFFALEIKSGQLQLTYNLGGGAFKLKTKQLVTDGQFHTISVHRMGMEATLTLDECGKMQPPGHCHASLLGGGASRSLPSRAWVWVGGLGPKALDRLARGQLESHDFVGCLAGVSVNGVPLQPRRSLASHNVHTSCESPREPCASGPCLNGGSCVDMWSSFYCKCRDAFAGKFCEGVASEHTALSLDGSSRLDFVLTEAYKRQRLLQEVSSKSEGSRAPGNFGEFEVTFRTRSENGVLAWIAEMQNVTALTVEAGQLVYIWMTGRSVRAKRRMAEKVVDDGTWHTIRLERVGHGGLHAILNGKTMWRDPDHSPKNFGGSGSTQLGIGGAPSGGLGLGPGYQGCIHSVRYNGMALPFSGHHPAVILKTFGSQQPTLGCSGPDLCGPGHPACAPGLLCVDRWLIRECELPGACSSSPCKNGGRCEPQPPNTFTCRCPPSHVGPFCETPIICLAAQCPAATECQAYGEIFRCVLLEPDIGPISGSMPFWVLVLAACALGLLLLLMAALAACMHRRRHKQAEAEGHSGTAGTPSGAAFSGGLGANKLGHKEGISNSKKGHKIGPEGSSLDAYSAVPGSRAPDGMAKPDIIEGDAPYLIVDETDIGESAGEADPNRGGPLGWSGSPTPEHYDLEAASSIAPSDADVISHYRRFRPRTALRGPSPLPPVTSYIPPGPSLLHHHHHHHAYPTLSSAASGRLPCTGLDICPNYAASQSISSCLHSGTGVTTISAGMRPCELRTVSPVGPLGPPVGLSLAEVERLNSAGRRRRVRPSQASTVEACSSSEEGAARESGRPTHRSYGVARAFGSESSGSESESHDSFTCSEFETERPAERPLRTPLAQLAESDGADANDDEDDDDDDDDDSSKSRPRLISAHRLRKARKAERFTTALPATFAWDALLNLSPNLGHYIDVCNDLAALSFEEPVRTEEVSVLDKPEQCADTCKQTPTILTSPNEPTVQETEEYI